MTYAPDKTSLDSWKNNYPNALIALTGYGTVYKEHIAIVAKDWTNTKKSDGTTFVSGLNGYNPFVASSSVYWDSKIVAFKSNYWGDNDYYICSKSDFPNDIPSDVLNTYCNTTQGGYTQTQYIIKTDSL